MLDDKTMAMLEKLKSQFPQAMAEIDSLESKISGEGEDDFMDEEMPAAPEEAAAPVTDEDEDFM